MIRDHCGCEELNESQISLTDLKSTRSFCVAPEMGQLYNSNHVSQFVTVIMIIGIVTGNPDGGIHMGPRAERKARTAVLNEEIHSIHYANTLFWREKVHSHEAGVEHYLRQARLEEIRCELGELAGVVNRVDPLAISIPLTAAALLRHPQRSSCQL